jgi:hypothetical protein
VLTYCCHADWTVERKSGYWVHHDSKRNRGRNRKKCLLGEIEHNQIWSELREERACRFALGNSSSQLVEAKKWSVLVIVGECWSLHQVFYLFIYCEKVNFFSWSAISASWKSSITRLKRLIIIKFNRSLPSARQMRLKYEDIQQSPNIIPHPYKIVY